MADRLTARDATTRDLEVCATLLAARHQRDRADSSMLPPAFADLPASIELLAPLFALGDVTVAERGDEVVAFMAGERRLNAADHWLSQYYPPRVTVVPIHGHAASKDVDLAAAYSALYGSLGDRWVQAGFFNHRAEFLAGDAAQRDTWFQLGFGAVTTYAGRDTSPIDAPALEAGIEVRRATPEDHAEVERLESVNGRFHHQGPMLWPFLWNDVRESAGGLSAYNLSRDRHAIFLGTRGPETLGMQMLFSGMAFGPPLVTPERAAYLFHGIIDPDLRSGGVGTALLEQSLSWARDSGHDYITLHYASMNPLGRPFWESRGFETIAYSAERRVDERVAWAKPPE